jgi:hypothetical protein
MAPRSAASLFEVKDVHQNSKLDPPVHLQGQSSMPCWSKPFCEDILKPRNYVFVVENLLTKELIAAHATRLRLYQKKELNVTAEPAQAAQHNNDHMYVVPKILDARCTA